MAKLTTRTYSRYTLEAIGLLSKLIRLARKEKAMTAQQLADRAGVSRGLVQRIEQADPKCELGAVFEVAAILGITLFHSDARDLAVQVKRTDELLALLPKSVRTVTPVADDDF